MPSIQPNKHHNSANLLTKKSSSPNNLKEVPSSPLATHQYNARPVFDIPRVPATRTRGNSIQENDNRLIELKTPQPVPPNSFGRVWSVPEKRSVPDCVYSTPNVLLENDPVVPSNWRRISTSIRSAIGTPKTPSKSKGKGKQTSKL